MSTICIRLSRAGLEIYAENGIQPALYLILSWDAYFVNYRRAFVCLLCISSAHAPISRLQWQRRLGVVYCMNAKRYATGFL